MLSRCTLICRTLVYQYYQLHFKLNPFRLISHFKKGSRAPTIFTKVENNVMYQHLKSHPNYRQTLAFLDYANEKSVTEDADIILNNDLSQLPKHKLVENFKTICQSYCCNPQQLSQPKFVKFCEHLIKEVPQLLDDHLLNVLKILTLWPRTVEGNDDLFFRICKVIDDETCKRSSTWTREKKLLTIDHFHRLGVMNFSSFVWQSLKQLCRTPERLTPSQLVQTLFLVMCNRRWHPGVVYYEWEEALAEKIYELSAEEATVVALGFFKTNKKITNQKLLNALIMKLESRAETLDSVSLTALLKIIRFSIPCKMRFRLIPLLDKLKNVIHKQSLTCCVHIASLGTRQPVFHKELLNEVFCKFVNEISTARLKEIERMIFIASLFSFNPNTDPNFFDRTIEELKIRNEEIHRFPYSLIYAVQFLCRKGIFDYDLMNNVLSNNFLTHTFNNVSKFTISCNLVEIACSAILDCPHYSGSNLDLQLINDFNEFYNGKSFAVTSRLESNRDTTYMQTKARLEEILGGAQFVHLAHVLPYSNVPQLIFCRKDDKPVVLPEEILQKYYLDLKCVSKIGDWYAIELWSEGAKISNTGEPVGAMLSKLRHLNLLGYKCCLLDEEKWKDLDSDKDKYLKSLIKTCR